MAEGGQEKAELKAGEKQTRNNIERRHGEEAVTKKATVVINYSILLMFTRLRFVLSRRMGACVAPTRKDMDE